MALVTGATVTGSIVAHGPFNFAFNTANLNTGVTLGYTPKVNDLICPMIIVTTAFDGTTPLADVGVAADTNGFFKNASNVVALSVKGATTNITVPGFQTLAGSAVDLPMFGLVTAATPLVVWASQTGARAGTAIGGTVGAASVYIFSVTPLAS